MDDGEASRNIWTRALFMVLLGILYSLSGTVLLVVAALQFLFAALGGEPNSRLSRFGLSLGQYIKQIVEYQTFNTEQKPFPFSDWP